MGCTLSSNGGRDDVQSISRGFKYNILPTSKNLNPIQLVSWCSNHLEPVQCDLLLFAFACGLKVAYKRTPTVYINIIQYIITDVLQGIFEIMIEQI